MTTIEGRIERRGLGVNALRRVAWGAVFAGAFVALATMAWWSFVYFLLAGVAAGAGGMLGAASLREEQPPLR